MIQNYKRQEAEEQDCVLAKKADIKSINQVRSSLWFTSDCQQPISQIESWLYN